MSDNLHTLVKKSLDGLRELERVATTKSAGGGTKAFQRDRRSKLSTNSRNEKSAELDGHSEVK